MSDLDFLVLPPLEITIARGYEVFLENEMKLEETNDLPETIRGEGGFGSTGK